MSKILRITEEQYRAFINGEDIVHEGVDWSKNADGSINMSINQKMDNNSNKGTNSVDTRVFGTKDDILNGKILTKTGKENRNSKSLSQNYNSKQAAIIFYNNVIKYIQNGRQGNIEYVDGLQQRTWDTVNDWFKRGDSDNRIIDACKKSIARINQEASQTFQTYNRVSQEKNNDKVLRYITGTVPYTNVKYISLFSMTDFNFSDAIKHGTVRQNGNTDKLLGIGKKDRELDSKGNYKELNVTYDGNVKPNVAQNFSLNNVQQGHYKQQYGLNGDGGYSSVSQFLDKSVNYAAYALKKEGFNPDIIVSAPSSSKFNEYYCTNLSNKLGIPYEKKFLERNMVNVRFDNGKDVSIMRNEGFSEKEILDFSNQVKGIAYKEIAYFISKPISQYVMANEELFTSIPLQKSSRQKTPVDYVINCLTNYAYQSVIQYVQSNDTMTKHLLQNFMSNNKRLQTNRYDSRYLLRQIQLRLSKRAFSQVLQQVLSLVQQYSNLLIQSGYRLKFDSKRFKITQISKRYRPYLNNVYIVADKYINQNGQLFSRYKNGKFLIFDEDINSGATLKLAIDAIEEKIPENNQSNILCLVNAYSGNGF